MLEANFCAFTDQPNTSGLKASFVNKKDRPNGQSFLLADSLGQRWNTRLWKRVERLLG
jgi:hypothetical protein